MIRCFDYIDTVLALRWIRDPAWAAARDAAGVAPVHAIDDVRLAALAEARQHEDPEEVLAWARPAIDLRPAMRHLERWAPCVARDDADTLLEHRLRRNRLRIAAADLGWCVEGLRTGRTRHEDLRRCLQASLEALDAA